MAIPHDVLYSPNYIKLSHAERSLLLEVVIQYNGSNNGMMVLTMKHLKKRGWNSADVVTRAKRSLIKNGFIFETVKGRRPSIASRYAITWQVIDNNPAYDSGICKAFRRGLYQVIDGDFASLDCVKE